MKVQIENLWGRQRQPGYLIPSAKYLEGRKGGQGGQDQMSQGSRSSLEVAILQKSKSDKG